MSSNKSLKKRLAQLKESFDLSIARPIETEERVYAKYIAFKLEQEIFAWPVRHLKEILVNQRVIPIPGRMESLYGVINYKNKVLTVTNFHYLLGIPPVEVGQKNTLLITRELPLETALWVDGLKTFLSIAEDEIKSKPISFDKDNSKMIAGEIYSQGLLITILNPNSVVG